MCDSVKSSIRIQQNPCHRKTVDNIGNQSTAPSVKTSAVIDFIDVDDESGLTRETLITNHSNINNNYISEDSDVPKIQAETLSIPFNKVRNKSTGDVIDYRKLLDTKADISASVDNIYENGLYSRVIVPDIGTQGDNSISDSLLQTPSSKIRPQKPKRIIIPPNLRPPFNEGDEDIQNYHLLMNASLQERKNLHVSKEEINASQLKERDEHSCHFLSSALGCDSKTIEAATNKAGDGNDGACKLKELEDVLDSQIDHLESLMTPITPPRTTSLRYKQPKSYVIVPVEGKGMETVKENHLESQDRKPVIIKYVDIEPSLDVQEKSTKTGNKNRVLKRVKSLKTSLSKSRRRVKSWSNVKFPLIRKPSSESPGILRKRRPLSMKELSSKFDDVGESYPCGEQDLKLRTANISIFPDHRTSKMIGKECEQMLTELQIQREQVRMKYQLDSILLTQFFSWPLIKLRSDLLNLDW